MAYKVFTNGSVLNASEINDNLMNQSVMVFSNSTARAAALTAPVEGMLTWLQDTNKYENYNGTAWVALGGSAILQVVTATSSTPVTNNSGTYVSTGLSATITPSSTSSKVMILARTHTLTPNTVSYVTGTIFRGTVSGTDLAAGTNGFQFLYTSGGSIEGNLAAQIVDSPNTTSAQTYTFAFKNGGGAVGACVAQTLNTLGSIILMEVAA